MIRLLPLLGLAAVICLVGVSPLDAKPGKGPAKGNSGKSFAPKQNGPQNVPKSVERGPALKPQSQTLKPAAGNARGNTQSLAPGEKLTGRDNAVAVQRGNEERKLQQRQSTAQKLREISARNGNENLLDTADRMDQKALDHYEQRNARIDELANRAPGSAFNETDLADELDREFTEAELSKLEPRIANERRALNAERQLQQQLDVAQKLRDLAVKNGNDNLIRTAENMETMAANRYAEQLQKLAPLEPEIPATAPVVKP